MRWTFSAATTRIPRSGPTASRAHWTRRRRCSSASSRAMKRRALIVARRVRARARRQRVRRRRRGGRAARCEARACAAGRAGAADRGASATVVERSRMSKREPGSSRRRVITATPDSVATEKQTVPTGLSSVPPPGPAMPVMPMPTEAPSALTAPTARASATSVDTAPCCCDQGRRDAGQRGLRLVGVDDQPAEHVVRGARPGRSAGRPAGRRCRTRRSRSSGPTSRRSAATCWSTDVPSVENSSRGWRSAISAAKAS